MCCPNTLQWQCRLYVYVFWMYGMVLLALDEQQVRSYWSCHPCSMWCEVVISTWCMCCSNNYNGDDNCTLCSWHVWNGVVLTLDEQRVRLYWCVFEFESVICVRNSMSSWSHSDVMCKYTTMVTATLCLYTTGGAFVLVCVWIWPSDSSSIQYEAVIWLTQMCVNTIQCRWRSHLLCPWWWMYVYVWNGTVSPRWPWTKRRCVCTGVLVDRCVFDFEGVIRVRYTIQYEVVISPWCTVQIHCNNGNDGCVSTPPGWTHGTVPCWPWTNRLYVCIVYWGVLEFEVGVHVRYIWCRNLPLMWCPNTLQCQWRLCVYVFERTERCYVDSGRIGCTFACIGVSLNFKLLFVFDTVWSRNLTLMC